MTFSNRRFQWRSRRMELGSRAGSRHHNEKSRIRREFKGYIHHATKEEPQYFIQSDKTDHVAIRKGAALRLLKPSDKRIARDHHESEECSAGRRRQSAAFAAPIKTLRL